MKRNFASVYSENEQDGYRVGDEAAHVAAAALAQRLDAPTIARITDMVTLLETVGGQFFVTPLRVQDAADAGAYNTEALVFNYETRDIKVQRFEPPSKVLGVPVTDSHKPGVEIEVERLREDVAAEVDEAEEEADPEAEPASEETEPAALLRE